MNAPAGRPSLHGAGSFKLTVLYGLGQAIPLFVAPALTRLYAPEELGQLAIFVAFVAIGATFAPLRFDQVVVVARARKHALHAAMLALMCTTVVAAAIEIALTLSSRETLVLAFGERAESWTSLVAEGVLLTAVALTAGNWLLRNGHFGAVGFLRIGQTGLVALLAVAFGVAGVPQGLIVAQASGWVLTGMVGGFLLSRDMAQARGPIARRLCALARRYWSFPVKGAPALFLDTLGLYLPLLMFAWFFGDLDNGHFALARQCLLAACGVLTAATGQAFMLAATQCVHAGASLTDLLRRQLARQAAITGAFLVGAVVCGTYLFGWFFGEKWETAGEFAVWLAFPVAAGLLVSPLSGLLLAVERVGWNSTWQLGHMALIATLMLPDWDDPPEFLLALLGVEVFCYGTYLALIAYSAGKHDRALAKR